MVEPQSFWVALSSFLGGIGTNKSLRFARHDDWYMRDLESAPLTVNFLGDFGTFAFFVSNLVGVDSSEALARSAAILASLR